MHHIISYSVSLYCNYHDIIRPHRALHTQRCQPWAHRYYQLELVVYAVLCCDGCVIYGTYDTNVVQLSVRLKSTPCKINTALDLQELYQIVYKGTGHMHILMEGSGVYVSICMCVHERTRLPCLCSEDWFLFYFLPRAKEKVDEEIDMWMYSVAYEYW